MRLADHIAYIRSAWDVSSCEIANPACDDGGWAELHLNEIPGEWQHASLKGLEHMNIPNIDVGELIVGPAIAIDPRFDYLLSRTCMPGFRFGVFEVGESVELMAKVARLPSWRAHKLVVEYHAPVRKFWQPSDEPVAEFAPVYRSASSTPMPC